MNDKIQAQLHTITGQGSRAWRHEDFAPGVFEHLSNGNLGSAVKQMYQHVRHPKFKQWGERLREFVRNISRDD